VAARADAAVGPLAAVTSIALERGAVAPGLKPGNVVDRLAVVQAVKRALEEVGAKANVRNADVAIVIPDGACRVLLLDFDSLPSKLTEALPLVRFRLKKLVPFDADDAMVSFQVMSQTKQMVRVLAVAIPRDVLGEYESVVREAGFEPGSVLPSTLASLAAVSEAGAALLVNVNALSITTAITREGVLLLHRTVDLQLEPAGVPANMPPALLQPTGVDEFAVLPIVSEDETRAEWAAQEPLPEHGRNPYADRLRDEEATQNFDGITALPVTPIFASEGAVAQERREPGAVAGSPYAQPTVLADLSAELHNAVLVAPTSLGSLTDPAVAESLVTMVREHVAAPSVAYAPHDAEPLPQAEFAQEVAQAVSVAAAYFEDTLSAMPETVLSAGSLGHGALERILHDAGWADAEGLRVRELVGADDLAADAISARVSRSALAGVLGALRG
jgi:type IV pilus assembly protein PilM